GPCRGVSVLGRRCCLLGMCSVSDARRCGRTPPAPSPSRRGRPGAHGRAGLLAIGGCDDTPPAPVRRGRRGFHGRVRFLVVGGRALTMVCGSSSAAAATPQGRGELRDRPQCARREPTA
ncbi:hypothetical protein, partial [Streptomyces fulvoviolaceus]|uniref:hypothetical protein n=1 Tax=Streptomyces fulvoviolaceus TaxID=285535 RepID=UPI001F1A0CD9